MSIKRVWLSLLLVGFGSVCAMSFEGELMLAQTNLELEKNKLQQKQQDMQAAERVGHSEPNRYNRQFISAVEAYLAQVRVVEEAEIAVNMLVDRLNSGQKME